MNHFKAYALDMHYVVYTHKAKPLFPIAMDWMFAFPQNSFVKILTPNVTVLEGGALER